MRVPTEAQYRLLRLLGSGNAGMSWQRRKVDPLLAHGWVTAQRAESERFYHFVRVTPEGLRALAAAVERYGLPDVLPRVRS
jgi:hypothetical protein